MNWSSDWVKPLTDAVPDSYSTVTLHIVRHEGEFPTPIEAVRVGDLAVHSHLHSHKEGFWQVTHVPTLARFNVVPHGLHKKVDLIDWCKRVQSELIDDWKSLKELTPDNYKSRTDAKDRIMEMCQRTEIHVK